MLISIPQCTTLEFPDTVNDNHRYIYDDNAYDFDWVFLEFPVINRIEGTLLTRPFPVL